MSVEDFRGNGWPTLGVELELQLVDPGTMGLACAVERVLGGIPNDLRDWIKPEFHQCYVEIISGVGRVPADVESDLAAKVRSAERAASAAGVRLLWGGTHPFSRWREQAVTPGPRYRALADQLGDAILRTVTFGMHVHVGLPDGDTAARVLGDLEPYLPILLALSANSPFWQGRASGLHSNRVGLLDGLPNGGPAPRVRDWAAYQALVGRMAGCGFIETDKELWWDARPNPSFGTIEVRVCDMPSDLPSAVGLAALVQSLVHALAVGELRPVGDPDPLVVRQDRWRAARAGLGAVLVDPVTLEPAPARERALRLVDALLPTAEALGCARELAQAASLARGPNGAEWQLELAGRTPDLAELARHLAVAAALGMPPDCGQALGLPAAPIMAGAADMVGSG